ncbi:hypothetical protein ACFL0V_01675 [Nanoarchaeota archaeon]
MIDEKKNGQRSHHHRDNEIKQIFQDLDSLKKPAPSKFSILRNIMLVLLVAMLGGLLVHTQGWLGDEISGQIITDEQTKIIPDADGYYGAVLMGIKTVKEVYAPGETATVEAEIASDVNREVTVTYELYNSEQKLLYTYTHKRKLTQDNMLQKKLLLTENYDEGEYFVEIEAKFEHEGKKFVLPGRTKFLIEKAPWSEQFDLNHILILAIAIALNITILINIRRDD